MSKLNLIHLAKNEVTKEESQKAKGGVDGCACPCTCSGCSCITLPSLIVRMDVTDFIKVENKIPVLKEIL